MYLFFIQDEEKILTSYLTVWILASEDGPVQHVLDVMEGALLFLMLLNGSDTIHSNGNKAIHR